jgi:hypothetical protein
MRVHTVLASFGLHELFRLFKLKAIKIPQAL